MTCCCKRSECLVFGCHQPGLQAEGTEDNLTLELPFVVASFFIAGNIHLLQTRSWGVEALTVDLVVIPEVLTAVVGRLPGCTNDILSEPLTRCV